MKKSAYNLRDITHPDNRIGNTAIGAAVGGAGGAVALGAPAYLLARLLKLSPAARRKTTAAAAITGLTLGGTGGAALGTAVTDRWIRPKDLLIPALSAAASGDYSAFRDAFYNAGYDISQDDSIAPRSGYRESFPLTQLVNSYPKKR